MFLPVTRLHFLNYCILTLMTPGKSTNTILCKPGPFTLKEMVCEIKLKLEVYTSPTSNVVT